jgi:hypothetical protein
MLLYFSSVYVYLTQCEAMLLYFSSVYVYLTQCEAMLLYFSSVYVYLTQCEAMLLYFNSVYPIQCEAMSYKIVKDEVKYLFIYIVIFVLFKK